MPAWHVVVEKPVEAAAVPPQRAPTGGNSVEAKSSAADLAYQDSAAASASAVAPLPAAVPQV
jgi:hypothetical protein